jgi:hypothetical protein
MVLSLISVWFLIGETPWGPALTPALTLPQVRYGPSMLLMEVFCTSSLHNNRLFVQWNRPDFDTFRLDTLTRHDIYVNSGIAV